MSRISEALFALQDLKYADFQSGLVPGIARERFIGVRMPGMRKLAKQLCREAQPEVAAFLRALPHHYYDENMLHGLLIAQEKDYGRCVEALDRFLPYVDNWAVCDGISPAVFKKHRAQLLPKIREWSSSKETYVCRFGLEMLMTHFLDEDFRPAYLEIPAQIRSEAYYVNMMLAWFYATALAKQWEAAIPYLEQKRLSLWVHNKTIQKARESYRITPEQKAYLKGLRRRSEECVKYGL